MSAAGDPAGAIVFTDVVGFTELTHELGDDVALAVLEHQDRIVRAVLPEGARVVKELGDGLLLWFDDVVAALCTTLDLQERYAAEPSPTPEGPLPLWVRMGVHWGRPRRRGDDIVGGDVNLASRVADLAGPGEVLCTAAAVERLEHHPDGRPAAMALHEIGPAFVKGIAEPVGLWRVTRT